MNIELSDKWVRRINSPLNKLAEVFAPAALTFGTGFLVVKFLPLAMDVNSPVRMRVLSLFYLLLVISGAFVGAVGFKTCKQVWRIKKEQKTEANPRIHSAADSRLR
jgi:hypothetical protein